MTTKRKRRIAQQAVMDAFMKHTGERGVKGPPLDIAFAIGAMFDEAPFPDTGLRHWAQILNAAADRLEGKPA